MKKKPTLIIITITTIILLSFIALKAKDYINTRYVESDQVYVLVPETQSTSIDDLMDDSGKAVSKGKSYSFVGFNDKGESRTVDFSYTTEDASKLLQPGQYLKVSVSKTIVLGQEVITASEVPTQIIDKLRN